MSQTLTESLNEQMNFEFYSAHVYLAMATYCSAKVWMDLRTSSSCKRKKSDSMA